MRCRALVAQVPLLPGAVRHHLGRGSCSPPGRIRRPSPPLDICGPMLEPCTGVPRRRGCAQRPRCTLNARPGSCCAHTDAHRGLAPLQPRPNIFFSDSPRFHPLRVRLARPRNPVYTVHITYAIIVPSHRSCSTVIVFRPLSAYVTYSASYYVPAPPLARAHTLLVLTAFDSGSDSASVLLRGTARRARLSAVRGFVLARCTCVR